MNQLNKSYHDLLNETKSSHSAETKALLDLYQSGNYQKGTLNEYTTFEVYQPKSKRRKYDDDGYRIMLLPERTVTNILIEDEIYKYFYGRPKSF